MSTAVGHGLADPKSRGKPVGYANEGWRSWRARGGDKTAGLLAQARAGPAVRHCQVQTHARPVSKGTLVNIPEPGGWTECYSCGSGTCLFWERGDGGSRFCLFVSEEGYAGAMGSKVALTWRQR